MSGAVCRKEGSRYWWSWSTSQSYDLFLWWQACPVYSYTTKKWLKVKANRILLESMQLCVENNIIISLESCCYCRSRGICTDQRSIMSVSNSNTDSRGQEKALVNICKCVAFLTLHRSKAYLTIHYLENVRTYTPEGRKNWSAQISLYFFSV